MCAVLTVAICVEHCDRQKLCSILSVGHILYLRNQQGLLGMRGGQVLLVLCFGADQTECHPLILKVFMYLLFTES